MTSPSVRRIVRNNSRLNFKLNNATFTLHANSCELCTVIWLLIVYLNQAGIAPAGNNARKAHIYVVQGARTYSPQPADLRLLPIPTS